MSLRLPSRKTALIVAGVIVCYLLFGWLALPPILQSQAQKFIAEKSGHHLTMEAPEFNPFTLSLRLRGVQLTEPDGAPLLAFKELLVDVSAASLFRGAYVFDAIRLDGLDATVAQLPGNRLNWSALIEALKSPDAEPSAGLPRLDIHSLILAGGRLDIADRRRTPAFDTVLEPLDIELNELSTLPNDQGQYTISARTGFGASLEWQGEVTLDPLAISGRFRIDGVALAKLAPLLNLPATLAPPEGTASVASRYRVAQAGEAIDVTLDQASAKVVGFKVAARGAAEPALVLDSIEAKDGRFDLRQRSVSVGTVSLAGGGLRVNRRADGRIDLLDLVPPATATPAAPAAPAGNAGTAAAAPWHYRVERIALAGFRADLRDQSTTPAAELALQDVAVDIDGVSDNLSAALPVKAAFNARDGGRFEAEGTVTPADPAVEFRIRLADLALKPAQAYVGSLTTLTLADGKVSAEGSAHYDARSSGYKGSLAIRDLRLTEAGSRNVFLKWRSLATKNLDVSPARLDIGDLMLDGLDTRLIIDKDKSVNVARIVRQPAAPPPAPADAAPATAARGAPGYLVNLHRLRIVRSEMEFADHSLALPFGTRIHDLHGAINGLSTRPGTPGQLELDGQVDDYGMARAVGQIDLFKPTEFTDLKVVFRNVEMTRLTPYSATFAGRKIDSGKLSLDLEYKINKRQLSGENQIVMDKLTLGERVESPEAKNLPLDLAIAILQDADGRIDLGLPVSGSLDDPQFSYGQIVWKAIVNVLTKIVTAPFRALGALFGSGEKLDSIAFEAGQAQFTPPEREKLVKLAGALGKRPKLALSIHGVFSDADRLALQDLQLRRAIATKTGQRLDDATDPGPLSTAQPKVQSAIESLFADRQGGGELAALKEGFRKANPGQLEESATGRMMSRLSGMFRDKRTLDESEVAQMKGADFHALLFERLRAKETVTDERLRTLATLRGEATAGILKDAGAPMDRVTLAAPEKIDAEDNDVPLKMELKAVGR